MSSFLTTPDNLPEPQDDGGADHLPGMPLAAIDLPSTRGGVINLGRQPGLLVLFCYPMTGQPGQPLPEGWDDIPGARGCTPQACSYRDLHAEITAAGAQVFGLSVQDTAYQQEMAERLHLPYAVLSDAAGAFCRAMRLPMLEAAGMMLCKRLALIARDGVIEAVKYPVFPSNSDSTWVLETLNGRGAG
ncbi:MAG: peroxiredoxin [Candidatus Puniceispirillales bacterium]